MDSLAKHVIIAWQLMHRTSSMLCENSAPTHLHAAQQELFVVTGYAWGMKEKLLSHMTALNSVMQKYVLES